MKKIFNANLDNTRQTCAEINDLLQSWLIPSFAISDIILSIDEALTNIMLHGYMAHNIKNGEITIEVFKKITSVNIMIEDKAPPYTYDDIPHPDIKKYYTKNVIGGFGVFIIKNLMDSVKVTRLANKNCLWISKTIAPITAHKAEFFIFSTEKINVFLNNGILKIRLKPGSIIDLKEARIKAKKYNEFITENPDLKPSGLLINIKGIKRLTKEARNYYSKDNPLQIQYVGLVVSSSISRWTGGFMVLLNKCPGRIIKLFNSEREAMVWLRNSTKTSGEIESGIEQEIDIKIGNYKNRF